MSKQRTLIILSILLMPFTIVHGQENDQKKEISSLIARIRQFDNTKKDSIEYYSNQARELAITNKLYDDAVIVDIIRAKKYTQFGNFQQAFGILDRNLEFHDEHSGSDSLEARIYSDIGRNANLLMRHDEAIYFLNKALKYFELVKDFDIISGIRVNLGNVYTSKGRLVKVDYRKQNKEGNHPFFDSAFVNYMEALNIAERIDNKSRLFDINYDLTSIYQEVEDFEKAIYHFEQVDEYIKYTKNSNAVDRVMFNKAALYAEMGDLDRALVYFKEFEKFADSINNLYYLSAVYENIALVYHEKGDDKNKSDYLIALMEVKDSLYNKKTNESIANLEAKSKNIEKDYEIEKLRQENDFSEKLNYAVAVIFFLALLFIGYFIFALKSQKRANKDLKNLNNELDDKNTRLYQSEQSLKDINQTKDKLFSIIAHDLRNPVNSIDRGLEYLKDNFDKLDEEDIKELITETSNSADSLNELLENLLNWSRSQRGLITILRDSFSLSQLIEINFDLFNLIAKEKGITLNNEVDNQLIYSDKTILNNILRNLIGNSLKFTPQGGEIQVSKKVNEDKIIISVIDNGVGVAKDKIPKLFDVGTSTSSLGTKGEKGTGLGLVLCKEFANQLGGDLTVESTLGEGTTVSVVIPNENPINNVSG